MSSSDQHQLENVKEDHSQKYEVKDDYAYKFVSDGGSAQLDDFLELWHDEIYRKKRILRLNDDCFFKIFSYLRANDLSAVSETCRDFQRLSHSYVEGHSKRFRLNNFYSNGPRNIRLSDAKRFLRNFGQYLTKLVLRNDDYQSEEKPIRLLPLIDRYCTKLQDLVLDVSLSNPMAIIQCERITSHLERLSMGTYMLFGEMIFGPSDVDAILTHFVALNHLELNGLRWIVSEESYVAKRYETLESLSLRNYFLPRLDVLSAFLSENCQLKRLKLSCCYFTTEATIEDNFTLPRLPNLESFWLQFRDKKYIFPCNIAEISAEMQLQRFRLEDISGDIPALKKLRIDLKIFQKSNLHSLLTRLAAHNIIEKLSIFHTDRFPNEINEINFNQLCALTTLKELMFECVTGFNGDIIKKLACGLPNLTCVGFDCCFDDQFTLIENFMEFSHKVHTIYLYTFVPHKVLRSPLTKTTLSSMVDARLRNKHSNETLTLFLNGKVIALGRRYEDGVNDLLLDCANVIRVLSASSE